MENKLEKPTLLQSVTEKIKLFFFVDDFDEEEEELIRQLKNKNKSLFFNFEDTQKTIQLSVSDDCQIIYGKEDKKEFYILDDNKMVFKGVFLPQAHIEYFMNPENLDNTQVVRYFTGRFNGYKYIFYEFKGQKNQKNDLCYIVYVPQLKTGFELEGFRTDKIYLDTVFKKIHITTR